MEPLQFELGEEAPCAILPTPACLHEHHNAGEACASVLTGKREKTRHHKANKETFWYKINLGAPVMTGQHHGRQVASLEQTCPLKNPRTHQLVLG